MKGYIYVITNLITNKQYIGQTIQTIKQRYATHISDAKNKIDNMYIHKSMNKYGVDNFIVEEVDCVETDNMDELLNELNNLEKYYILSYNTLVPNGYNLTKGGNEYSEKFKLKVDEYDLDGNFIQTHDSIIDAAKSVGSNYNTAIRKCCYGKSKFAFQRIWRFSGEPFNKYKLPNKILATRSYKMASIDQYDLNGNYIKTFDSISNACRELNINESSSHISECCTGKIRSIYGYIWRYHDEPLGNYSDLRIVSINKFDLDGNFLKHYCSLKEACLDIGKEYNDTVSGNIRRCCKGERKSAYKFKWKYAS